MIAVLAATTVGLLSAFLPFTPVEPYLIAAAATTSTPPVTLGIAAAAGQTAGKLLLFLATRTAIRSPRLRHLLTHRPLWLQRRPGARPLWLQRWFAERSPWLRFRPGSRLLRAQRRFAARSPWLRRLLGSHPLWLRHLPGPDPFWLRRLPGSHPFGLRCLPGPGPLWLRCLPGPGPLWLQRRSGARPVWAQRWFAARLPWLRPTPAVPQAGGRLGTMLARRKGAGARLIEVLERPRQAAGVLLVSAVTGVPPLLAVSVYLGRTPMRPVAFAATCMLGRTIRFVAIALAPQLVGH